jgi:hypothetical protein
MILHKNITGDFGFDKLFAELSTFEIGQYGKLLSGASAWTQKQFWELNSSSYLTFYKEILNG